MFKSFLAASVAVSLIACVQQDEAPKDIARALPTAQQMSIKLPESAARLADQNAVGQLAEWYVSTRDVTRTLNGGTAWVLILLHEIVKFPVTSVDGDVSTWGPWSDTLDPAEYKLDVRAVGDGTYEYQLSGRSKTQANAQFEVIIDGKADPRPGEARGNGTFTLDFDAGKRVNPIDSGDENGTLDVSYDLAQRHLDLTAASSDAQGQTVVAEYAYNETADGAGDMVFGLRGNAAPGEAVESLTLRSRWLATGAGRADARIGGGDLGALTATGSECWDAAFKRVFFTGTLVGTVSEGAETACAFATADLPLAR